MIHHRGNGEHRETRRRNERLWRKDVSPCFSEALRVLCGAAFIFCAYPAQAIGEKKPLAALHDAVKAGDENRQFVKSVQQMLAKAGYMTGKEADGHLGARTRDAIKRFQKDNGLKEDGRLTPNVFELLAKKTRD